MPEHTYDSMQVGDTFEWSRTISAADVQAYADVSGDDNPLHLDPEYAATTPFGEPIVHGAFLLGVVSKVLGRDYPGHGSVAVSLSAKFLRPVPIGSEVRIEVKVAEKVERFGHVRVRVTAYNEAGKTALGGEAVVIPPKE
ncbi:MAG: MaoC family dehydratase [Bacteroidota bacterium]